MTTDQPRSAPVYTIGKVEELTGLTARQIRYYEARGLVRPDRSEGNQRLYTPEQVELLKRIRGYLAQGLNVAGIRRLLEESGELREAAAPPDEVWGQATEPEAEKQPERDDVDPIFDEYPARHLLGRGTLRSIYPLSHPEELLKRVQEKERK